MAKTPTQNFSPKQVRTKNRDNELYKTLPLSDLYLAFDSKTTKP